MNVECSSKVESHTAAGGEPGPLLAMDVQRWVQDIPKGATIRQIVRDFGTQRDPDVRLVGLHASWSEGR